MNQQICVICQNINPINSTDNRLVTESCGHVKCMNCLLKEKSGCVACLQESYDDEDGGDKLDKDDNNDNDIVRNESADNDHIVTLSGKLIICKISWL